MGASYSVSTYVVAVFVVVAVRHGNESALLFGAGDESALLGLFLSRAKYDFKPLTQSICQLNTSRGMGSMVSPRSMAEK